MIEEKFFFTGIPCQNGHIEKRYKNTGICYQCKQLQMKRDYELHKDRVTVTNKRSQSKNRIKGNERSLKWSHENKEKSREIKKRSRVKHIEKNRAKARLYSKRKRLNTISKLHCNISRQVWGFLKGQKLRRSSEELIGISFETIKQSLEKKFDKGMSWENYGTYWEIDHINPVSTFESNLENVSKAWHPDNLQPLEKHLNRSKQDNNNFTREEIMDKKYYEFVDNLANGNIQAVIDRLNNKTGYDLMHAALGMTTETAEVVDVVKKHLFYGIPLDKEHIKEELGDLLFYFTMVLNAMGSSFEEVMQMNYEKLSKRYPTGSFSEKDATERKDMK